jgi:hypothetical protein
MNKNIINITITERVMPYKDCPSCHGTGRCTLSGLDVEYDCTCTEKTYSFGRLTPYILKDIKKILGL